MRSARAVEKVEETEEREEGGTEVVVEEEEGIPVLRMASCRIATRPRSMEEARPAVLVEAAATMEAGGGAVRAVAAGAAGRATSAT